MDVDMDVNAQKADSIQSRGDRSRNGKRWPSCERGLEVKVKTVGRILQFSSRKRRSNGNFRGIGPMESLH